MNITFNKLEILLALTAHVAATGISLRGKEVTLADDADISIEVSIDDPKGTKRTTRKPRGPNKATTAKAEVAEVAETEEVEPEVNEVADAMEGKTAPVKKAPTRKKAVAKKAPAKKKRMFGSAKT